MMGCHTHGQGLSEGRKERKRRKCSTFLTGRDNKLPTNSGGKIATRNEASETGGSQSDACTQKETERQVERQEKQKC